MKIINSKIHGTLDYAVVLIFLAAPTLCGFSGLPAAISYALSAIHLVLTLVTAFPLGVVAIVPLRLHGAIELVVSICLVALPWALQFSTDMAARNFYVGAGATIFLVWLVSDYRPAIPAAK